MANSTTEQSRTSKGGAAKSRSAGTKTTGAATRNWQPGVEKNSGSKPKGGKLAPSGKKTLRTM